ncbi:MAG: hypothetical protein U0791_01970 [Gemmataceae bacterium]
MEMREGETGRSTPDTKRTPEQKKLMQTHQFERRLGFAVLVRREGAAELKKDAEAVAKMRSKKPVEQFVRVMTESSARTPPTFLFSRGDADQPPKKLEPGA